jgi:hypothetical protein
VSLLSRPRTSDENLAVEQMRPVQFPVGSWDKRFYRDLSGADTITEKQVPQLWRLFIKYRRQIDFPAKARLMAIAEQLAAPDFRKLEAQRREQARIDEMRRASI